MTEFIPVLLQGIVLNGSLFLNPMLLRGWKKKFIAISKGYSTFISGMQRGVDLWAAEIVLRLHDAGENVHLIAATPFKGMESRWNEEWQSRYSDVIKKQMMLFMYLLNRAEPRFFREVIIWSIMLHIFLQFTAEAVVVEYKNN